MRRPTDLANVDLNLLYTFHAVVEQGGVGAAARVLRRSQPAVTSRVRQLERDLGVVLLERAGRGVRPTMVGRAVLRHVSGLVTALGGLLDELHAASGEPVGTLRLGALTTLATYVLPSVLADFVQRYPRLRIDVSPGLLAVHIERLSRGELDAVVSVGDVPDAALAIRTIGEVRAMAAVPAAMARRRAVGVRTLREHPFVAYGRVGDSFFDRVWSFVERAGIASATRVSAPHIDTIKSLVAAGAGLSILPDYTIVEPALAACVVDGLDLVQPAWIGFRPSAVDVPILAELADALRARWPVRGRRRRRA